MWSKLRFRQDIAEAQRDMAQDSRQIRIVAIDIDGFKKINDTLGHDGGDDVLRSFGAALVQAIGPTGTGYHLSGDEFALILRGGDVGEISRRAGESAGVECSHGSIALTAENTNQTPQELHDAADQELLKHKQAKKGWWARVLLAICGR
jgi:diguanylate cyclase (GGDEF)-like protein